MGPPSLNGGNASAAVNLTALVTLQWGRRLSTAEIRKQGRGGLCLLGGFNGAAVSQRRK